MFKSINKKVLLPQSQLVGAQALKTLEVSTSICQNERRLSDLQGLLPHSHSFHVKLKAHTPSPAFFHLQHIYMYYSSLPFTAHIYEVP